MQVLQGGQVFSTLSSISFGAVLALSKANDLTFSLLNICWLLSESAGIIRDISWGISIPLKYLSVFYQVSELGTYFLIVKVLFDGTLLLLFIIYVWSMSGREAGS